MYYLSNPTCQTLQHRRGKTPNKVGSEWDQKQEVGPTHGERKGKEQAFTFHYFDHRDF